MEIIFHLLISESDQAPVGKKKPQMDMLDGQGIPPKVFLSHLFGIESHSRHETEDLQTHSVQMH